jgi:hypothetical protein
MVAPWRSYGLYGFINARWVTPPFKALMRLVKSQKNSASTSSDTRVLALEPVEGCTRTSVPHQFVSALVVT